MGAVADAVLRANPSYELVLLDRLSSAERDLLEGEGDLYGVLRPRSGAELTRRTAAPDTALLFLTLREPGTVPSYVRGQLGGDADRAVTRLVLDGVLEIEQAGKFASGAEAGRLLLARRSAGGRGRVGELSIDALRYGQELAAARLAEEPLAMRLYSYGRRPVTAALARRLGDSAAVAAHLGIDAAGTARPFLDASWVAATATPGEPAYWLSWQARRAHAAGEPGSGYKLYVSPDVDALAGAVVAVAGSLAGARGVTAFKVGADVSGLCRPDKLVVYFDRLDDLRAGAATLCAELDGCPAQGVPFTAAVTGDGLLSWGADPPAVDEARMSWRLWVAQRLAEYLARGGSGELEPWEFALERLRLAGIDTDTWIPASGMWEEARASA